MRFVEVEIGRSPVVKPDQFVPFVLGETFGVKEREGILPAVVTAEVQEAQS